MDRPAPAQTQLGIDRLQSHTPQQARYTLERVEFHFQPIALLI